MNKGAIKTFAITARKKLIKSVQERLYEIGITKEEIKLSEFQNGVYFIGATTLTETENQQRDIIIGKIKEKGFDNFVEEVAYTWFNRLIAVRYMEVNDYLPFRTRVLSSEIPGKVDPDIITQIYDLIDELELDINKINELKDKNQQEQLFKYVFIKVCNNLGKIMPQMFEYIADYTELLIPNVMLAEGSVVHDMVNEVPEVDWTEQVEIIGWLYQYYISEKKDKVFADLKKNKKITKENIPAATQIFTPDWIVKYMVENSIGRIWLETHPSKELQSKWNYYLEEAEQEVEVENELENIRVENRSLRPEQITVLDPSMGSGHILVYAFDVLYEIYKCAGYSEREIPILILQNNIYGLDIDDRAGQLAYFALIMKARSYSRRIFRDMERKTISINICSIQESNCITKEDIEYFANNDLKLKKDIEYLIEVFIDAKEYGSILNIQPIEFEKLEMRISEIKEDTSNFLNKEIIEKKLELVSNLIKQGKLISKKYNICITNPPYMGNSGMNSKLSKFLADNFSIAKSDLYAAFIKKGFNLVEPNGFNCMVTMQTWMFLSSLENLRKDILDTKTIVSLNHMGNNVMGIAFGTSATIYRNKKIKKYKGMYTQVDISDIYDDKPDLKCFDNNNRYYIKSEKFNMIPGSPIAYWVKDSIRNLFQNNLFFDYSISDGKNVTGNNEKYLRYLWESKKDDIGENKKWLHYTKGGTFRRWYGNLDYIIDWSEETRNHYRSDKVCRIIPDYLWYKKGISWTYATSGLPSFRLLPTWSTFDSGGLSVFLKDDEFINYYLALFNTKIFNVLQKILNPTVNLLVKDVRSIPVIIDYDAKVKIDNIVDKNILFSKVDWDAFETSWDFKKHPIFECKSTNLENSFCNWEESAEKHFNELKANEEELNRIFIDIYGLHDELTPEVEDKDITIRKADREREIKSFISYAVGCMLGRYSLDEEGLVFAGGEFDINRYKTFKADEDNIIPITDAEYFEDDIVSKFLEFVKVVFGEDSLEENLNYIADTECFKRKINETSRECLRRYFLKGFIEDHLKVYQKRPIYWMFDSGKQNGFKALVYMHRYSESTVAEVRTDYLHPLQRKYEDEVVRLDNIVSFDSVSASEKTKAKKQKEKVQKQLEECTQYDLLLGHVANQKISIDLDDGVKVNYNKFQGIELSIEGAGKVKKFDLLYKAKI